MTDEQLKAIWQRWERSTPGEWTSEGATDSYCIRAGDRMNPAVAQAVMLTLNWTYGEDAGRDNADFIANAHQDIPALRAHIEALTAENERLRKQVAQLERKVTAGDDLLYAMDRLVP